jgi:hypothetical protein
LAAFGRQVEKKELTLPNGCYVNYDLSIIEFLKSLDGAGTQKDYEALRAVLGRRPTITEFYHSGSSMQDMRRREGHWFALVESMADLSADETDVVGRFQIVLREICLPLCTTGYLAQWRC